MNFYKVFTCVQGVRSARVTVKVTPEVFCLWYTQTAVASFGTSNLKECGRMPGDFTRLTPAVMNWVKTVTGISDPVSLWRELLQLSTREQFGQTFSGFSPALDKIGVYLRLHLVANNVHTIWHNSDWRDIHAYTNCYYVGWTETEQTKLNISIILSLFLQTALYVSAHHTLVSFCTHKSVSNLSCVSE